MDKPIDGLTRLSAEGTTWVRESLESGHALAHAILKFWALETGVAFAITPPGFPPEHLNTPQWGQGGNLAESAELLGRVARTQLGESSALVVVEDPYMEPTDPVFEQSTSASLVFGTDVYHWMAFDPTAVQNLGRFISRYVSYPTNAVVVRGARAFTPATQLTVGDLAALARDAVMIVVSAYDNEGFIIWGPDDTLAPL